MKKLLVVLNIVLLVLVLSQPVLVLAQGTSGSTVEIPSPISCKDVNCLVSQVIRYILGIIAIIATAMFVWGGLMMLTSAGNAERVKRARETLAWAAIGIVVILLSWAIIRFVLSGLVSSSGG